ncbi:MAG: hypothetical protein JWM53_6001 [bacterium]|nr:hypothetical protein [bacterium]
MPLPGSYALKSAALVDIDLVLAYVRPSAYKLTVPNGYKNAPIAEAIYEFSPTSVPKWYEASPRQLIADVGDGYPVREDVEIGSATFQIGPAGVKTPPPTVVPRTRLWTADKKRMFQFGQDLCAFNALAPYTSYYDYLPAMRPLVEFYAARTRATSVLFLGQRYLNQILLPDVQADPADYFAMYPRIKTRHQPFAMQLGGGGVMHGNTVLSLVFQGLDAGVRPRYLLDIYVRTSDNPPIAFQWDEMQAWQDNAHQAVLRAFEEAITDTCRGLFGGRKA